MRRLIHLVRRFFGAWRSRTPPPGAQVWIAAVLSAQESAVFWDQPVPDQDHALRGARRLRARFPERDDLVCAFLLHDVGKRHTRLGTIGRSLATALDLIRIPLRGRYREYFDHGRIGAAELERLGSAELTVEFARHHQHGRPRAITEDDWRILVSADRA